MNTLADLVIRAQAGDVEAYGRLVQATQTMAYAVALSVVRDSATAQDATQQAYLRAFRRIGDLQDPATFAGWLRRIVITVALNMRRASRRTFLCLDEVPDVPILDEAETRWSEAQRQRLSSALMTLTPEERQFCDRRYHGRWSTARLAATRRRGRRRDAQAAAAHSGTSCGRRWKWLNNVESGPTRWDQTCPPGSSSCWPGPGSPTCPRTRSAKCSICFVRRIPSSSSRAFPRSSTSPRRRRRSPPMRCTSSRWSSIAWTISRILRYDLTLPLLLTVRHDGQPLRIWAAGKCYRLCQQDAMHLEVFHQAEVMWLDERSRLDPWQMTGRVLRSVDQALPGRTVKIVPTQYAMCSQAWELEVDEDGQWSEVLAWGVFSDRIVSHLGGDPARHIAVGVGYGLERIAMLRYGIDDARKIDVASVA